SRDCQGSSGGLLAGDGAEVGPGGGAELGGVGLVGDDQVGGGSAGGVVVDDRGQVALGEAPGRGGDPEACVNLIGADQGGQLQGGGHLGPDPDRPGRGGLDQPGVRAVPESKEGPFGMAAGSRARQPGCAVGLLRVIGVVGQVDLRGTGGRELVAGDLDQPAPAPDPVRNQ